MKGLLTITAFCLAFVGTAASAAEPAEPTSPVIESAEVEESEATKEDVAFEKPDVFGSVAAIFPGLVFHGAGHWAAGDRSTGYKLALAQLSGIASAIGGISILAATGADPRFTPPGALMMIYGVGLFAGSFLADLYGVASPQGGFGSPVTLSSWLDLRSGYRHSYDRIFEDRRHAGTAGASYRVGWYGLDLFAAGVAPSGDFELGLDNRFRFTGPRPDAASANGSYSDAVVGYDFRTWSRGAFDTHTIDLYWDNRLDLVWMAPSLDGMFVQGGLGVGLQTFVYEGLPDQFTTLLLARMGIGIDLGESRNGWGEMLLFYDHRHDGPTGGFKVAGLGSGTAGHFGLRWEQHVWKGWGFYAESTIGSAWVNSIGVERRFGGER